MLRVLRLQHINIIGPRQLGWLQSSSSPRRICRDLHLAKNIYVCGKAQLLVTKAVSLPLPSQLASFICRQQFVRSSQRRVSSCASCVSPCRHPCRLRLSASCIGQGSCSLHIRLAMPSSSFFRNALRISFARNTVTKGC